MNIQKWVLIMGLLLSSGVDASCDLTRYRWECDIRIQADPSPATPSLVYCGNSYGYVSRADYDTLVRFSRRSINMVLKINGEFTESPCIPGQR